jgi:hypothetical protein
MWEFVLFCFQMNVCMCEMWERGGVFNEWERERERERGADNHSPTHQMRVEFMLGE